MPILLSQIPLNREVGLEGNYQYLSEAMDLEEHADAPFPQEQFSQQAQHVDGPERASWGDYADKQECSPSLI